MRYVKHFPHYICSLLIDKDCRNRWNISVKFPCVYLFLCVPVLRWFLKFLVRVLTFLSLILWYSLLMFIKRNSCIDQRRIQLFKCNGCLIKFEVRFHFMYCSYYSCWNILKYIFITHPLVILLFVSSYSIICILYDESWCTSLQWLLEALQLPRNFLN